MSDDTDATKNNASLTKRTLKTWGKDIALLAIGAGLAVAASVFWEVSRRPELRFFLAGAVLRTETSIGATLTERRSEVRDRYNNCIAMRFRYRAATRDVLLTPDSVSYVDKLIINNGGRTAANNIRISLILGSRYSTAILASPNIRLDTISAHDMGPVRYLTVEVDRLPGQQAASITALSERAAADPRDYQDFSASFFGSEELPSSLIPIDTIKLWTVLRGEPQLAGTVQGMPIRALSLLPPVNEMNVQLDDIHQDPTRQDSLCAPFTLGKGIPFPDTLQSDYSTQP